VVSQQSIRQEIAALFLILHATSDNTFSLPLLPFAAPIETLKLESHYYFIVYSIYWCIVVFVCLTSATRVHQATFLFVVFLLAREKAVEDATQNEEDEATWEYCCWREHWGEHLYSF
jgi:hypothetical protein